MKTVVLSSLVTGLAFLASLFFYGTDNVLFVPALLLAGLSPLCLFLRASKNGFVVPIDAVTVALALFALWLLLALPFSSVPYVSVLFTCVFLFPVMSFFAVSVQSDRDVVARTFLAVMMVLTGLLCLGAVAQFFFNSGVLRVHLPLRDPNTLAVLVNIFLIPALAGFMAASGRRALVVCAVLSAIGFMALLATQSRGGLLCALIGLALLMFMRLRPITGHLRRAGMMAVLFVGILTLAFAASFLIHGQGLSNLSFPTMMQASVTDRFALWGSVIRMIADHPLTGTGLGTFAYYYSSYRSVADRSDGYFAHMDPLQIAADAGIAAMLLFYILAAAMAWRTMKALKSCEPGSPDRVEIAASFTAIFAVALHAHIYFHLYMLVVLLPLSCLLAVWYAATMRVLGDSRIKSFCPEGWARPVFVLAAIFFFLLPAQWIVRTGYGVLAVKNAAFRMGQGDVPGAMAWLSRGDMMSPRDFFHLPQYKAQAALVIIQGNKDMSADDKAVLITQGFRDVADVEKFNHAPSFMAREKASFYVQAYESGLMVDGYERAALELSSALKSSPRDVSVRLPLVQILMHQRDMEAAVAVIEDGLRWPPVQGADEVSLMLAYAEILSRRGEEGKAQEILRQAADKAQAYGLMRQ